MFLSFLPAYLIMTSMQTLSSILAISLIAWLGQNQTSWWLVVLLCKRCCMLSDSLTLPSAVSGWNPGWEVYPPHLHSLLYPEMGSSQNFLLAPESLFPWLSDFIGRRKVFTLLLPRWCVSIQWTSHCLSGCLMCSAQSRLCPLSLPSSIPLIETWSPEWMFSTHAVPIWHTSVHGRTQIYWRVITVSNETYC